MRKNDVYEMADRLYSDYAIETVNKVDGELVVEISAKNEDDMHIYEICRKLNGYDKADFFSIRGIEKTGAMTYKARVVRVVSDEEENQTKGE